eukprot:TRINITY_DN3665_c0_g3_i1.p1 TRINITY_DN3665_c0_g3~~TRINITY_DN3665_c0_g3_i1.p1  ORF type:complete len:645 (+),score=167.97 TRINITY_DN3665_c0_g3_i1:116-2050(+)
MIPRVGWHALAAARRGTGSVPLPPPPPPRPHEKLSRGEHSEFEEALNRFKTVGKDKYQTGAERLAADVAAAERALNTARDDSAVQELFRMCAQGQHWGLLLAIYQRWVSAHGWQYARPQVELTTPSLNYVLQAMVHRGVQVASSRFRVAVLRLFEKMQADGAPERAPDTTTYTCALQALARDDLVQNKLAVKRARSVLSSATYKGMQVQPAAYEAVVAIYNTWQVDARPLWLRMRAEGVLLTPPLVQRLVECSALSRDPAHAAEVIQYALAQDGSGSHGVTTTVASLAVRLYVENGGSAATLAALLAALAHVPPPRRVVFTLEMLTAVLGYLAGLPRSTDAERAAPLMVELMDTTHTKRTEYIGLLALCAAQHASDSTAFFNAYRKLGKLPLNALPGPRAGIDWFRDSIAALCTAPHAAVAVAQTAAAEAARVRKEDADPASNRAHGWVMLGAAALTHVGMTDDAMGYVKEHRGGVNAYMAILAGFASRPYERHHEVLMDHMTTNGVPPTAACYDICIKLSCQGDDLDSALRWLAALTEAHPMTPPSKDALSHLLYSACVVADVPLALGVLHECTKHRYTLDTTLREAAGAALRAADWRGTSAPKLDEALEAHDAALLSKHRTAMEESVAKHIARGRNTQARSA